MNLNTQTVWELKENFSPQALLSAFPIICKPGDILVLGCYNPSDDVYEWLNKNSIKGSGPKPYSDNNFDLNRTDYPKGRSFELAINNQAIHQLKMFCDLPHGGMERQLFFEHLLIYRPGVPVFPLVNYHDAFSGGEIHLSGHYTKVEIDNLCTVLKVSGNLRHVIE